MSEQSNRYARNHFDAGAIARAVYNVERCELLLNGSLRHLLNEKSLYQSTKVPDDLILKTFLSHYTPRCGEKELTEVLNYLKTWLSTTESFVRQDNVLGRSFYQLQLPATVKTYCELCECVTTHNPGGFSDCYRQKGEKAYTHVFHAEYECQDCKAARVAFMIMRKGLKFQIMGRSPIEIASLSKEMFSHLIDDERELFGDALMANKTGSELASVCLLRVALERYLRRVTGNLKAEKMVSGDELYEQYKKRLPDDFCHSRVVPLDKIYNDLSSAMHSAEVPDGCFERNFASIELFFRFLSLMPLQEFCAG